MDTTILPNHEYIGLFEITSLLLFDLIATPKSPQPQLYLGCAWNAVRMKKRGGIKVRKIRNSVIFHEVRMFFSFWVLVY